MTLHGDSQAGTLTRASLTKYLALVEIDAEDSSGFTPLALAVKNGHPSAVKLLLQNGAQAGKPVRDGRTPLYLAANAKQNRPRVVELLLGADPKPQIDASSPDWNNETPLMAAITQGRDPEVVRLLTEAGASLTKTNDRGETAVALADQTTNPAIKNALNPKAPQGGIGSALAQLLVSAVMFALAYADKWPGVKDIIQNVIRSAYNQANPTPPGAKPPPGTDIDDPQTVEEFQHNIGNIIQSNGLEDFFPPNDPYVQQVAQLAATLRKDQTNHLSSPPMIMRLAKAALYQTVLYIDDSGSMAEDGRMDRAKIMVTRLTRLATALVPDTNISSGVHLRFINKDDSTANDLREAAVSQRMQFTPEGWTELGTNLEKKILQPMVYDNLNSTGVLPRPLMILIVTDGMPSKEDEGTFRKTIMKCKGELTKKGYLPAAVQYDLSQIGNAPEAVKWIQTFDSDSAAKKLVYFSTENTDSRLSEFKDNDAGLDDWLSKKLHHEPVIRKKTTP
ncbi:hypothetical protein ASPCAL05039 [Aspergillus calidoustus]|uniref:Uncharacterized protein n=1 Tax=Aspergillus calidoustus TaxID=454130 RepID=A0A0U5FZ15_ASPCI|nr:hypothetical protein ASPCAL05039 [Aspergillus calidoustus]